MSEPKWSYVEWSWRWLSCTAFGAAVGCVRDIHLHLRFGVVLSRFVFRAGWVLLCCSACGVLETVVLARMFYQVAVSGLARKIGFRFLKNFVSEPVNLIHAG